MANIDRLSKLQWTGSDFDSMLWRDCRIYASSFLPEQFEFRLDLDYISEWVAPLDPEENFTFWVAPALLRFENASEISIDIKIGNYYEIEVVNVTRALIGKTPNGKLPWWRYSIETNNGLIALRATGFHLTLRQAPIHTKEQVLPLKTRGGIILNL